MVILDQLPSTIRRTTVNQCLLTEDILSSNIIDLDKDVITKMLPEQDRSLWTRLIDHFTRLLKFHIMNSQTLANKFAPILLPNNVLYLHDKAKDLIKHIVEKLVGTQQSSSEDEITDRKQSIENIIKTTTAASSSSWLDKLTSGKGIDDNDDTSSASTTTPKKNIKSANSTPRGNIYQDDRDEYVVIWLNDLIPTTPNEKAYEYDSQEEPPKMDRPITRDDINQIVMEVSEQDCLGSLSNIHLAYADKEEKGIKSKVCTDLAGWISQEVDAAKTGKHPLTEEQIAALRKNFGTEWPDFMKARGKKDYYPSERILGKLYRSARRAANGWVRAISNHGNSRHIQEALALTSDPNKKDRENDETIVKMNIATNYKPILDPYIKHKNYGRYLNDIQHLYRIYQSDLLEIISLYRFHDEVDLLCRCDSMDASASGKKGGIEDSAAIEVKNLTQRTIQAFLAEFKGRDRENNCDNVDTEQNTRRPTKLDCELCNRKITVHCETCNAKKNAVCKNCNKEIQAVCNTWHNKEYVICINCEQKITVVCETCNEKLTVDCETCHEKKPIVMKARKRRIRNHCETCNKILTILCETCDEKIQAKVTAAYIYTYEKSNRLPPKSTQRILSYPWLFSKYLTRVRYFNKPRGLNDQSNNIIGHAFLSYLHEFKPTFKVFVSTNSLNIQLADLHYEEVKEKPASLLLKTKRSDEKICSVPLLRILFIEILNDWFMKQKIFGNECKETDQKPLIPESIWHELIIHFLTGTYQSDVRISSFSKYQNLIMEQYCQIIKNYCQEWSNIESKELYEMFDELHSLTIEHTKRTESTLWSYLDEYIILALQCIGIEKQLTDKWIFLKDSI
ncbi:unnamed protein product [Adineta steineri]|uniref:RNA-dependent RNA polymerase n=1 Tax=Adineta steineri TaxID=433720 RepID=A0A815LS82_9BILA|nr:unnamed protein product [Adineta steineri]